MFRKIITYFLILAVVLPILASAIPFSAKISYAQENEEETTVTQTVETKKGDTTETVSKVTKKTSSDGEVYDPCGWFFGAGQKGGIIECSSYTITGLLYDYVLQGTIWIAGLAGTLFNASIQFSLTGKVFDASENGNIMIKDGWTLVRDLLNLVFIFILLFAAISTILQYGGFEIKKVLPSLIVAALLINFSMMIAKMVIDASHIFAWEFYNQIDVKNENKLGDGKLFANMKNDINVYGDFYDKFEKKNLANVFIAGFNPQELLTGKEAKEGEEDKNSDKSLWKQVVEAKRDEGVNISGVWWQAALIILLESALALFAGFVLLAGAIMFVIRVVVLWLVMIFSPLAFLSMILPSMKKYSDMWWNYLINQSFFAPAFLFMFMLATKFINSKFIESIFQVSKNSDPMIVWGINGGTIALTFFHFFVVGGLMMACLIVARQLGGKTAEFGIGGAHRIKGWALGGASRIPGYGWMGAKYGWAGTKAGTRRFYAPIAEDFATGKGKPGRVGDFMRRIPILGSLATRKASDVAAKSRAIIEEKQKKYGGYTPKEMTKIVEAGGMFDKILRPYETTARARVLDEKKSLKDADPEIILQAIKTLESIGNIKGANDLKKMRPDLAGGVIITPQTARPLSAAIAEAIKKAVGFQKPEDITELKFETNFFNKTNNQFDNQAAEQVVEGVLENYKSGQIRKLYERGDDFYNEVVQKIHNLAPLTPQQIQAGQTKIKAVDIANAMRQHIQYSANKGLATALESGNLNDLLGLQ